MIGEWTNHLWQSTVFAASAGLLTLAFRKNRAQVRYWLWFSASLKFLIPFSLLLSFGSHLEWTAATKKIAAPAVSSAMAQISEPFPDNLLFVPSAPRATNWVPIAVLSVWACGFLGVALMRLRAWLRIRAAVRASTPINIPVTVEVRYSPGLLEPGVVGWLRPILLLPADITDRLTPPQLEIVLAHELCHVRRRDNLTSAIHMIVEAAFWFHPLVWWIGARLVEEREQACDEEVLRQGNQPGDYAGAILNVCKSYLESRLPCVSGVTGSDLKKRIGVILAGRVAGNLSLAKKIVLVAAGITAVVLPIFVGGLRAQSQRADTPKFEVASIKACGTGESGGRGSFKSGGGGGNPSPGRLTRNCTTVKILIQEAYNFFANGKQRRLGRAVPIEGGPAWIDSDRYRIEAKAEGPQGQAMLAGPMMQVLLEDRFKLKVHRETREVPVYLLTVAKGGSKNLQAAKEGNCVTFDFDHPPPPPKPGQQPKTLMCGMIWRDPNALEIRSTTLANLCEQFSALLDRPVIDKTGIDGIFDIRLEMSPEETDAGPRDPAAPTNPENQRESMVFATVRKLGLKLESAKGPGQFLVIDHVEKPAEN